MRIHTKLTREQMLQAAKDSGAPVSLVTLEQHGSRTHARSFEVALAGTGGRPTGFSRRTEFQGATWDEWGAFLGALYDADIDARCGGSVKYPIYRNAEHYHYKTGSRFRMYTQFNTDTMYTYRGYLPTDTHRRHKWLYSPRTLDRGGAGFHCTKCSATRPTWDQAEAYAPRVYTS